jgi:hypothetical protein
MSRNEGRLAATAKPVPGPVRSPGQGEEGSALIFALLFLSLFGLLASGLLSFADAGIRSTVALRGQAASIYSADGGMEIAINSLRSEAKALTISDKTSCVGQTALPATNGISDLVSTCTVLPPVLGPKYPVWALNNPEAAVMGPASTNAILGLPATPPTQPTVGFPGGVVPKAVGVPTCSMLATNWLITLYPGSYTDENALNLLTNGKCQNHVIWFSPGDYYFDFTVNPVTPTHQWTISDKTVSVVAGTPLGGWAPLVPLPKLPTMFAKAGRFCATDQDPVVNPGNPGVRWAFGGESTVSAAKGTLQVCASPSVTTQEVAVLGLTTGDPVTAPTVTTSQATTQSAAAGWTIPNGAITPADSKVSAVTFLASVTGKPAAPVPAPLSLGAYDASPWPSVPSGLRIESVKLLLSHQESGAAPGGLTVSVTSTGPTAVAVATSCTLLVTCGTTMHTDTVDVTAAIPNLAALQTAVVKLSPTVAVVAAPPPLPLPVPPTPTGTESVDGAVLQVTWAPLALRPESGCVVTPLASGGCPLLQVTGTSSVSIFGTVVAPLAGFVVSNTQTGAILTRGVVAQDTSASEVVASPAAIPVLPDTGEWDATLKVSAGGATRVHAAVIYPILGVTGGAPLISSWVTDI